MKALLNQSKVQLILTLLPILILSPLSGYPTPLFIKSLFIVLLTVVFDLLFIKIRKVKPFFPSAAIATGLILSLIIDASADWYILIAAPLLAMYSKNFIRKGRHIFNPAAFGAFSIALLFSSTTSWWGPAIHLGSPLYLLVFLPIIISFFRMKRYYIIICFLVIYSVISVGFFKNTFTNLILDPTLIFFSIVMLPEPMTTPNKHIRQVIFGIVIAVLSFVIPLSLSLAKVNFLSSIDPFIISLLLGNLLFFKLR